MATFNESYQASDEGGRNMTDGTTISGLGGFATGAILGGLVGWAFGGNDFGRGYGYNNFGAIPYPVAFNAGCGCGCNSHQDCYSLADVSNLVATKDAQYASLNATQSSEFNILNTMSRDNTAMAKDLCGLAYENAQLANATQLQVAQASAKADLCCCQTQGMISRIVPELKQFYLEDEVAKLRNINAQQNTQCGFDKVNMNLNDIGCGVKAILNKLYEPTATATA